MEKQSALLLRLPETFAAALPPLSPKEQDTGSIVAALKNGYMPSAGRILRLFASIKKKLHLLKRSMGAQSVFFILLLAERLSTDNLKTLVWDMTGPESGNAPL